MGDSCLLKIEAECYGCLTKLLSFIQVIDILIGSHFGIAFLLQDNYVFGQPGIVRALEVLARLVYRVDGENSNNNCFDVLLSIAELSAHLRSNGIELIQICFRWMNCLLVRELPVSITIRLWDTYVAEGPTGFSDFHTYVCAGMCG